METKKPPKLIHVGLITLKDPHPGYLFLKQLDPYHFTWFEPGKDGDIETAVSAETVGAAIHQARQHWKFQYFRTLNCGFRYTLPERDEHGCNALFYQMAASYASFNGIYFDEDLGNNCFVNFASQQALALWRKLTLTTAVPGK
jgi:hypothetical protein